MTDLKEAEAALQRANEGLEVRVAERTVELEEEAARRQDLARRLVTAQEDERRRVSRDLHDSAGQLLVGLGLAFKAAEAGDLPPATAWRLSEARHIVEAPTREIHDPAARFRPTALDGVGLEPSLSDLVGGGRPGPEPAPTFEPRASDRRGSRPRSRRRSTAPCRRRRTTSRNAPAPRPSA